MASEDLIGYALADVHTPEEFEAGAWADLPAVSGDVFYGLEQVAAMVARDKVPLFVAGDNIDGPDPDPRTVARLYEVLRPISAVGESIYYILGNHDRGRDWLAPFGPSAKRLDGKVYRLKNGGSVTGLSWVHPSGFAEAVKHLPATNIGLYHQTWAEWVPAGKSLSVDLLPAHDLAICGDVHVRGTVSPKNGPRLALSPGPIAPQSVTEFGQSLVWSIHAGYTVNPVALKSRGYLRFEVTDDESAESCLTRLAAIAPDATLPTNMAVPMAAVRVKNPTQEFVDGARKLANDRGFILRIVDQTPGVQKSGDATVRAKVGDLADAIRKYPDVSDKARSLALDLVAPGADMTSVLSAARAEYVASIHTP